MMTSYFANMAKLIEEGHTNLVAISQGVPKWNDGKFKDFKLLAPSWKLVRESNEGKYEELYTEEVLSKLDARKIYEQLGEDAVLLCWEKPNEFCHRHLVAKWFEQELGIKVDEFVPSKKTDRADALKGLSTQMSLFDR